MQCMRMGYIALQVQVGLVHPRQSSANLHNYIGWQLSSVQFCSYAYFITYLVPSHNILFYFHFVVISEQLQAHIQCQRSSWLVCCCYSSGGLYLCIVHSGNEQCTSSVPCTSSKHYHPTWCDSSNICWNHSCEWCLHCCWKHLPTTNHC